MINLCMILYSHWCLALEEIPYFITFDDIISVVIYALSKQSQIYNLIMIKIDNQTPLSYQISEISKDSELLSLFNQHESNDEIVEQKQDMYELSEIKPETNFNFRGYYSDHDESSQKNKQIKKSRHIVNKKQKQLTKKRTKIYIQMLENRINQLQTQNEKLRKLNKINKQYIHRLNESEHHINGYFVGKQQVLEKLELLNSEPQPNKNKIVEEIISLRIRQGAFGKDRIKSINYYFKEMVEMLLPQIQKYLIKTSSQNSDFFDPTYLQTGGHRNELEGWRKKLLDGIELDNECSNFRQFLKNNQLKMNEQTHNFKVMLQNFYQLKCELIKQAKKLEEIFDGAHKQMSPLMISKSLCYIDRYRFQKNISLQYTFSTLFEQTLHENFTYNAEDPFGTNS